MGGGGGGGGASAAPESPLLGFCRSWHSHLWILTPTKGVAPGPILGRGEGFPDLFTFTILAQSVRFEGSFYAWAARFYAFQRHFLTLGYLRSICVISISAKTATKWRIWKTRFGWLPIMQDPINFKLTRTLARTWIFSLATAFSVVEVPLFCGFSTMSSKRKREMGSCDRGTGVWKKKRCHQVGSSLRPSRSSDLRDKGRSTLTVPRDWRVKLIFFRDYCGTCKRAMKHTHTHTYTHTHTHTHTQRAANCYGSLINVCYRQNGTTLMPIGPWSLTTTSTTKIDLHFLSRYKTINGPHWAAEVCCTKWVSSHVLD